VNRSWKGVMSRRNRDSTDDEAAYSDPGEDEDGNNSDSEAFLSARDHTSDWYNEVGSCV
jgi:hypothetical protein